MTLSPGDRLGPYEIVSRLGAGGMGEVWRARDTRLDRSVAIKILPSEFAPDAKLKLRFEREAKVISQLNHPHICTLFDVGDNYLVMELLEGESLADRLTRGPLPISDVLRFGAQIADALDRAHRAGIVHRDLKPGNVMLTKSGAKLLDFGLAKTAEIEFDANGATQQKPLTAEGTIVGTYQYMAPEQLEGLDADPRSDLWALGAVLYEMATGRRAFEGKTRPSLIAAIFSADPPAVTELQPLAPPALEHVIVKCLTKSPDDRWQSAHDVAEELRWIAASSSRAAAAVPRPRRWERWFWAAALLVAAAAAPAAWLRPKEVPRTITLSVVSGSGESIAGWGLTPAFSPDGRQLTYTGMLPDGTIMLFLRNLETGVSQPLRGTEGGATPFWSPDGRGIAFTDAISGSVKKLTIATGKIETLAGFGPSGCSWTNDDRMLCATNSTANGIEQIAATGGERTVILKPRTIGADSLYWPAALPDGNHFLFLAVGDALARQQRAGAWIATRDGSEPPRFLTDASSHVQYVWPGYLLFARGKLLYAQRFDLRRLRLEGRAQTIGPVFSYIGDYAFTASNDGLLLYQESGDPLETQLVLKTRKGETIRPLGGPALNFSPHVSGDGRAVAFDQSAATGTGDIWIDELATGRGTRVSFDANNETAPVWSPDGAEIAYTLSGPDPLSRACSIVRKRLGGGTEVVMTDPYLLFPSDWSPDRKYLLIQRSDSAWAFDVAAWSFEEKKLIGIASSPAVEMNAVFSPDGKWVAYQSDESGRFEIYVQPFPPTGGKEQISTNGGEAPCWRKNEMTFIDPTGHVETVNVTTTPSFHVSPPEALFSFRRKPLDLHPYDLTPDGNFVVNEIVPAPPKPMTLVVNWYRRFDSR